MKAALPKEPVPLKYVPLGRIPPLECTPYVCMLMNIEGAAPALRSHPTQAHSATVAPNNSVPPRCRHLIGLEVPS